MTNSKGASLPGAALLLAPNPILRKRARELTDRERARTAGPLIARLFAVMEAHNGAGLAAPQIGESLRVFVMGNESFVNPVIIERSDETIAYEEGCLSLPGVLVNVQRHVTITLQTAGRIVRLTGQSARVAQHEIDHLDGVLIIDRGAALEAGPPVLSEETVTAYLHQSGRMACRIDVFQQRVLGEAGPLGPDGAVSSGGTSPNPLSQVAAMAVDLGPPDLSSTFRQRRGEAGPSPRDDDELGQFGEAVRAELLRAEKRWPDNEIFHRLAALSGEVGELAQGVIKNRPVRDLYAEAVQVAVCAFRATKALGVRGESLPPKYTLAEIEQAGDRFNVASAEVKLK